MRKCWPCWRGERDEEDRGAEYGRAWVAGYEAGVAARRPATIGVPCLDPKLVRDAVALCHPDRHPAERAAQANRVTAKMLEGRRAA